MWWWQEKNLPYPRAHWLLSLLLVASSSCGGLDGWNQDDPQSDPTADSELAKSTSPTTTLSQPGYSSDGTWVTLPLSVASSRGSAIFFPLVAGSPLGLTTASAPEAFALSLTDCESGYTATLDEASSNLQVYKYDKNCLAKLTSFTFNGFTFTPSGGSDFTTWQAGDTAHFIASENASLSLSVRVVSTLGSPIMGTETVAYDFYTINTGTTTSILQMTFGTPSPLSDGVNPDPSFQLKRATLVAETAGNGAAYILTLNCSQAMIATSCNGVDLADIRYVLVEDLYSSTPTYANAQAAFLAGARTVDSVQDFVTAGSPGAANGGFVTKGDASILTTPDDLASHPHMILFLEASGVTFQYINVDVSVSSVN